MVDLSGEGGHLRFAPTILRRLGEELNPNIDQGILELVKNAYDADAKECHVWLGEAGPGRQIVIGDNGAGMTRAEIENNWLVLGSSQKSTRVRTRLGRTPAGNKGLGRLAALRLGRRAEMRTRSQVDGLTHIVNLDWDTFDLASTVDEVPIGIESVDDPDQPIGTRITLSDLRRPLGRVDVRRLARALVLLADPFADTPASFTPSLHSNEFDDLATLVRSRYFDEAEYHLKASLRDGRAEARITDWRGETIWTGSHDDLRRQEGKPSYETPDATLDFWVFILSPERFTGRAAQISAVREWLKQFGGVHVYVNGLRVAPYGNPGNDWLDINLARVRSPEVRPSTNTAIGRLLVDDKADRLTQKTDRSGFIESEEFSNLNAFATDALEWMARRRMEAAEQARRQARREKASDSDEKRASVQTQLEQISDAQAKRELTAAFAQYDRARNHEADQLRKEIQLYRTLSTAGITAATFAHESNGNPLKTISLVSNTLRYSLRREFPEVFEAKFQRPLEQIGSAVESLGVLANVTLDLISQDKRRVGKVALNTIVQNVATTFMPFLEGREVRLDLQLSGSAPYMLGTAAAVESIVTNLINNSLAAFERLRVEERQLQIMSRMVDGAWEMTVSDNGPGIEGIALDDIWLPGETQRVGGTGLGLTIVRDSVSDLRGSIEALPHGDLGGASFIVRLPLTGVDDD